MNLVPGEGVVEDESVYTGVSGFKLSLHGLFVSITPSQRNQDLFTIHKTSISRKENANNLEYTQTHKTNKIHVRGTSD